MKSELIRKKPDDNISKASYVEIYCINPILCMQFAPDDQYKAFAKDVPDESKYLFDPYVSYPCRKSLYDGWNAKYYPAYESHPCVVVIGRSMLMRPVNPLEGIISFYKCLTFCVDQARWSNCEIVFGSDLMKNIAAVVADYMKIPVKGFDEPVRNLLLCKKITDDLKFIIEEYQVKSKIEISPAGGT